MLESDSTWDRTPVIKCDKCGAGLLEWMPLHKIKEWNGKYFRQTSLKDHGLRVQLGHHNMTCQNPQPATHNFTILHVNSIHKVAVDWCCCLDQAPLRLQCLHFNWYPATSLHPCSCTTVEVLHHFHMLMLAGNVSAYEYYHGLIHMTNNAEVDLPKTQYHTFFRLMRQFHHLHLMKRFTRGHVEDGIASTNPGQLTLGCLSCPHPGVNLPEDWKDNTKKEERFIHWPVLAVDANFRMSSQDKLSEDADPGLHTGLAYYVKHDSYVEHVCKYASQKDISSCSGFRTLAHAESKCNKGLQATGIGICVCARHKIVLPLAAGDLQVGERYCNMDYIAGSASKAFNGCKEIFFSYDISCQWQVKLRDRMQKLPPKAQFCDDLALNFALVGWMFRGHNFRKTVNTDASEALMKHRLKEQDRILAVKGAMKLHSCSPAAAMGMGLLIEEMQQHLMKDFKTLSEDPLTLTQHKEQHDRQVTLRWQLTQFRDMQAAYMPGVASLLSGKPVQLGGSDIEHESLLLPSVLTSQQRAEGCRGSVKMVEEQLCEAQCLDTLDVVHGIIQAQRDSFAYCDRNMQGQVHITCTIAFIKHLGKCLDVAVTKEWEKSLRIMTQADVTSVEGAVFSINDGDKDVTHYRKKKKKTATQQVMGEAEGFQKVLWIWMMEGSFDHADDKEMNTELLLVKAEMKKTLLALEHRVLQWERLQENIKNMKGDTVIQEGRRAYAERQVSIWRRLATSFQWKWSQAWASTRALQTPRNADEACVREAEEEAAAEEEISEEDLGISVVAVHSM
ncbi:hypothetical protein EDD18DRAFT_1110250 [Armillaria luteobubalina]|uniref:CxC2-like cysteine cluster KDZ transposase-associated domain-containing protein n=1 Tax=Armillaria luteobubalina TaxID=153913 RepID=A0AA39PPT7_9AGAR|nr:hypothetical protein EDD18DRAFT_1110250 [Armillaria luteobubalina]